MKFALSFLFLFSSLNSFAFVPNDALTFEFNIKTIRVPRSKEFKLDQSVELLKEIFASPEFRKRVLNHRYKGRRLFAHNRGLSNAQIYHRILAGAEKLLPYKNNTMDVEVELYTKNDSTVIGYTKPLSRRIWMNTKYFNRHSHGEVASHLTHEWLHKLGFDHERERTPDRKFSVPYAVGYIIRDLAKKYSF
jgi:hypothetical protein